jgi:hypothetical protein
VQVIQPQVQPQQQQQPAAAQASGPYAQQLHMLLSMGFQDRDACLLALQASNGNLDQAVETLLML